MSKPTPETLKILNIPQKMGNIQHNIGTLYLHITKLITTVAHQLPVLQITTFRMTYKPDYIFSDLAFQHFHNAALLQTRN